MGAVLALFVAMLVLPSAPSVVEAVPASSKVLFFDDFDSYAAGSSLAGLGGWNYGGLRPWETLTVVSPGYQSDRGAAAFGQEGATNDFKMYRIFAGTDFERLTGRVRWDGPVNVLSGSLFSLTYWEHAGPTYIRMRDGNFAFGTASNVVDNVVDSGLPVVSGSWYVMSIETRPGSVDFKIFDAEGTQLLASATLPQLTAYPYTYVLLYPVVNGAAYTATYDDIRVEEVTTVTATVDIDPNVLNLKSRGNDVNVYIELRNGFEVARIDVGTVRLAGIAARPSPTAIGDYDADGISDLMLKFDRGGIGGIVTVGDAILVLEGELSDGTRIEGQDTIHVIQPGA